MTEADFAAACANVCALLDNECHSHIYTTPDALHRPDTAPYLNMVVIGYSYCDAQELTKKFRQIEHDYGRRRETEKKCVALDIDIVLKNDIILKETDFAAYHFKVGYKALQKRYYHNVTKID